MSEPTVVFVFSLKHWYTSIRSLSKVELLDIVPHVGSQFGFDYTSQSYLLVITKTKWSGLASDLRQRFMMISRRIKEEMEGPMTTVEREEFEAADLFAPFANETAKDVANNETATLYKSVDKINLDEIEI